MTCAVVSLVVSLFLPSSADMGATALGEDTKGQRLWVFVGTYTGGASKGIYRFVMDLEVHIRWIVIGVTEVRHRDDASL